ncbi:hypothetical protein MTR67_044171 [Solanum verrucosum]|uniref:Tf2-1-like SH3-like domain-containing protein n=1 Tax=Solanum verrucosum TaxID=315347 RepID=A0AAF0UTE3_SOLVR|nr:hypothetical protein MTR67_044171 [Solanum verrucosum]
MKGVMRFGKKWKLIPRYVGPYKILKCFGKVSYEHDLPNDLISVHPVFYVSLFKKCLGDLTSIVPLDGLGFKENLSYEEVLVKIFDRSSPYTSSDVLSSFQGQMFQGRDIVTPRIWKMQFFGLVHVSTGPTYGL